MKQANRDSRDIYDAIQWEELRSTLTVLKAAPVVSPVKPPSTPG